MTTNRSANETSHTSSYFQRAHSTISSRLKNPLSALRPHAPHIEDPNETRDVNPQNLEAGLSDQSLRDTNVSKSVGFVDGTWSTSAFEDSHSESEQNETHEKSEQLSDQDNDLEQAKPPEYTSEAEQLVRQFTLYDTTRSGQIRYETEKSNEDTTSPNDTTETVQYKPSVFGLLLGSKFNDLHREHLQSQALSHYYARPIEKSESKPTERHHKPTRSYEHPTLGTATPSKKRKWYETSEQSISTTNLLVHAGMSSLGPGLPEGTNTVPRPSAMRPKQQSMISTAVNMIKNGSVTPRSRPESFIAQHDKVVSQVADIIACRTYLIKLCEALLRHGAPTHRVEDYLKSSANALFIEAEFMYIPGAMMCTFIDRSIQSNNVEIVKEREGLDLGRLKDVFDVYKCVIHNKYSPEEGIFELENIANRPDRHNIWFRIFIFGLASVIVGPFSFNSRPIDFVPIFFLGCTLGFLQLKVVPHSLQFSNVFEVLACVLVAFIARGLGSIRYNGAYLFCFSATAQSSIAMILPGFLVLNSALELQSHNMVSGSVRMVYAIIYVLFLGFGLLVGTTVFGLVKRDAVEDVTCTVPNWFSPADNHWKLLYTRFIWVPLYAACAAILFKAKWKQLPVMVFVATCGYQAYFWIATQLSSNLQVANAVGAFVVGCLANLYSRLFHGLAAAAMLPAIYCLVPGGLAASGSLVAGINSSNQIFGNTSSISVINNGTSGFVSAQNNPSEVYGGTIFNVGYGMVQVAIGISIGLYLSALVVYPYGKGRSGLFAF